MILLSIDLEEWFQGLTSTAAKPEIWPKLRPCLSEGAQWLLDVFDSANVQATFFVVGLLAEQYPSLMCDITRRGHELALHGYRHESVSSMSRLAFRRDTEKLIALLADITGEVPIGYRAPWFSITRETTWFWEELARCGVHYDSSIFPIRNPLYGLPDANPLPYLVETQYGNVSEYPITTFPLGKLNVPFSGGFYFRMLPSIFLMRLFRNVARKGLPVVTYFHPWEFVPDHHRPGCVTRREKLSHYTGLTGNRKKLLRLLQCGPITNFRNLMNSCT